MTRLRTLGRRTLAAVSVALLVWIAATRSTSAPLVSGGSAPQGNGAIESVPTVPVTVSDRPLFSDGARRAEGPRLLATSTGSVHRLSALVSTGDDLVGSPSLLLAGPMALGVARRGPPGSVVT